MRTRRRWNLVLGLAVLVGGMSLMATPAFAAPLVCPTESCGDQCYDDCWQSDCQKSYCDDTGCYDNHNEWHQYDTGCESAT